MHNSAKDKMDKWNKWIFVYSGESEEGTDPLYKSEYFQDNLLESDLESDGISIITNNDSISEEECSRVTDNNGDNLDPKKDTKKWTFANSKTNSETMFREIPPKTFFLNCLHEPVQELSEHELEASTDEITFHSENGNFSESKKESEKNNKFGLIHRLPAYNYKNSLLIATIILAAICMYLENNIDCTDQATDDLYHHQVNYNNIPEGLFNNIDEIHLKYNISNVLYFCQQKYKSDDKSVEPNIQKCLLKIESMIKNTHDRIKKKKINQLEKNLKMKEHYLNEKEKFLIKKEYELAQTEMKIESEKTQFNFKRKNKFDSFKESSIHHEFAKRQMHRDLLEENIRSMNKIKKIKNNHKTFTNNKNQQDFDGENDEYSKSDFYRTNVDENKKAKRRLDKNNSKNTKRLNHKEKKTNYKYDKVKNKEKYERNV